MTRTALLLALLTPTLAWATSPLSAGGLTEGGETDPRAGEADLPDAGDDDVQAIINGSAATLDDFPMTGGMLVDMDMQSSFGSGQIRTFVCSSTLIAPDVVLLAAHCLDPEAFLGGQPGSVTFNDVGWTRQADLSQLDGSRRNAEFPADTVFATDWVVHPEWNIRSLRMGLNENRDIALLFLEEPLLDVPYAYLPTVEEAALITEGAPVNIVGWGQQVATSQWQAPPAGTYATKEMAESFISKLAAYEFKVGEAESDARKCHGDSGGPSFFELPETETTVTTRLIGVTSHAYDMTDCNETGGVDTRVDYYLTWIDAEMRAACDDGRRVWCDEPGILVPEPLKKGCGGCSTNGAPAGGGALAVGLLGLLGLRRRRG